MPRFEELKFHVRVKEQKHVDLRLQYNFLWHGSAEDQVGSFLNSSSVLLQQTDTSYRKQVYDPLEPDFYVTKLQPYLTLTLAQS